MDKITKNKDGKYELTRTDVVDETEILARRSIAIRKMKALEERIASNKKVLAELNIALGRKAEDVTA